MFSKRRIKAAMIEPVCTSFSPAAHPAVRSYKQPKGFVRDDPKTLLGNIIAFRCLFLAWVASLFECPIILEQPRLSKMAWLSIWRMLLERGFAEAICASCQFGSIHRKEFRLLCYAVCTGELEVRCPGGHRHVRIEGQYTKPSAQYVPELAKHFARVFATALSSGARRTKRQTSQTSEGLSPLLLTTCSSQAAGRLSFSGIGSMPLTSTSWSLIPILHCCEI